MNQLPAFFQAYASGDQATLGRFLAPGTSLTGLGGELAFGSLAGVTVPAGGDTRSSPPQWCGVSRPRPGRPRHRRLPSWR